MLGIDVGIVGINTAWLSQNEKDRNKLTPGAPLLEEGLKSIKDCDVRIVLGHHPLSWLADDEVRRIRASMDNHAVLYLHGHLHRNEAERVLAGGDGFLSLQAAASFQAREEEIWKNGILWCEIDTQQGEIRAQPQIWSSDHQEWKIDTDAFPNKYKIERTDWWAFPLPNPHRMESAVGFDGARVAVPQGWDFVDSGFLTRHAGELNEEDMLRFFDGRRPTWKFSLSGQVPRRGIVKRLRNAITDEIEAVPRARLIVLLGASGEGKSTAFLQTICDIVRSNAAWSVLWRHDDEAPLAPDWFANLPRTGIPWLVATDNADQIVGGLVKTLEILKQTGRSDVHFFVVAKDTDWRAAERETGLDESTWRSLAEHTPIILRGLDDLDAKLIVDAWSRLGTNGLGHLAEIEPLHAAERLVEVARAEAVRSTEGAFLGAMLRVRYGDGFKDYVKELLYRLKGRPSPGGTLLNAFAYIAAMHSENLTFLSKPVLMKTLGCDPQELKSKVLYPLGEEAAAVAGTYILTRHKAIAETAMEILAESDLCDDTDALFVELAKAALGARLEGEYIPQLHNWDYALPDQFMNSDRPLVAIALARAMYEIAPTNVKHLVNLSRLYRAAGESEQAVELFRDVARTPGFEDFCDRTLFCEWSVAEGIAGNLSMSVWLLTASLADADLFEPLDNARAKLSLASLGSSFAILFEQFYDETYNNARNAVAKLGLRLHLDETTLRYLTEHFQKSRVTGAPEMGVDEAVGALKAGIIKAVAGHAHMREFPDCLPHPTKMSFDGLETLVQKAARRP